jgi:hypothetical protein
VAALPPISPLGLDPTWLLHPNAPAAGGGFGNARLPGPLGGNAAPTAHTHADAPAFHAAWYDPILGVFPKRVMAVYDAITGAHRYLGRALIDATGMELHEVLAGILPSLLIMVAVLALTTTIGAAAGAALGALAFGVGAAPGAVAGAGVGLEAGTLLLEWLGLAFLVVYIGKSLLAGTQLAATAVGRAWHSVDEAPAMRAVSVVTASHELASAVAVVFRGVLQGVVAFLLAKGVAAAAGRVPELVGNLRKSRLGGTFASWVERNWAALVENPKLKDTSHTAALTADATRTTSPSSPRATRAPLDDPTVDRVLSTPKGVRPKPSEYLSKDYIDAHLAQFQGGVSKISASAPPGTVGPPGGTFVLPKPLADELIANAAGNVGKLEQSLGLDPGTLGSAPLRIDIANPQGLRMPSGNELGANTHWLPGGYTSGGLPEGTIDPALAGTYTVKPIFP